MTNRTNRTNRMTWIPASILLSACLGVACVTTGGGPSEPKPNPVADEPDAGGPDAGAPDTGAEPEGEAAEAGDAEAGDVEALPEVAPPDEGGEDEAGADAVAVGEAGDTDGASEGGASEGGEPSEKPPAKTDKAEKDRPALASAIYKKGTSCQIKDKVGTKVKNFKLPHVDGKKTVSPGQYRNRVMVLNFWGTWCKPCLAELPKFDRLYKRYRKNGMTLVAVATDEEPEKVQEFIDKHKLKAKVALDGEEAAGQYGRPNFPFTYVVNGSGKIVAAYDYIEDSCLGDLESVIREELKKL